jgi:hypothetical protein
MLNIYNPIFCVLLVLSVYTIYGFEFDRYRHRRHQELPTNYLKYNIYLAFFQTVVYFPLTLMLRQFSLSHITNQHSILIRL